MIESLNLTLPIVIYFLLIILVVVGIILGIKAINTLDKVDRMVDDIEEKIESLNGFFKVIDFATDKISSIGDRVFDVVTTLGSKIFFKKKRNRKESEE